MASACVLFEMYIILLFLTGGTKVFRVAFSWTSPRRFHYQGFVQNSEGLVFPSATLVATPHAEGSRSRKTYKARAYNTWRVKAPRVEVCKFH